MRRTHKTHIRNKTVPKVSMSTENFMNGVKLLVNLCIFGDQKCFEWF